MKIMTHEANSVELTRMLAMADAIRPPEHSIPQWALDVRNAMPDWGFEIHCIRWLTGLDMLLLSIRESKFYPSPCGRYGDVPGFLLQMVEEQADAVEDWLLERPFGNNEMGEMLGERSKEKEAAARCFVEITRAFVEDQNPEGSAGVLGKIWREKAGENTILQNLFHGVGLDEGLFSGPSYWLPNRLHLTLRIIGGDLSEMDDLAGSCNYELRNILRDDPQRLTVTLAYLWGAKAYLDGRCVDWLRDNHTQLAGAAIHVLHSFSNSSAPGAVLRWLAMSLLATIRFWYQRALIFTAQKYPIPDLYTDIPDL